MKVNGLLVTLSINSFDDDYKGIYTSANGKLQAFTSIKKDVQGDLLLFRESKKPPLLAKDFLKVLMLNKKKNLYY
ncbi:hypothetical protein NRIC_37950 [Enterococcus florum]|uniref:Uncharacterized protein n=1 Tax=Enterococcus florum TaxID=2480627 RepID=A0A4P5PGK4_9ENTE|nr:hypothetical protein [Enterococcus florum]GCF95904.1 hypothetical protein NRIC_37950 [Enterococcus florum]